MYLQGIGQPPLSAADRRRIPLEEGRFTWETGMPPPAAPGAAPQPSPRPAPTADGMTPKARASLAAKRAEEMPQARLNVESQGQDFDRLTKLAQEIKKSPGLSRATGMMGAIPSLPGGQAAGAEALINSMKAQISAMKLQAMRNASKTGGAVGQVTEKEWPRLENMIVALDPVKMDKETFQSKLDELVGEISKAKKSVGDAFTAEYGAQQTKKVRVVDW